MKKTSFTITLIEFKGDWGGGGGGGRVKKKKKVNTFEIKGAVTERKRQPGIDPANHSIIIQTQKKRVCKYPHVIEWCRDHVTWV